MKLFIPACGDRLNLVAPWTFDLYLEHRNLNFAIAREFIKADPKKKRCDYGYGKELQKVRATLPIGTTLECDRVYIRTFNKSRVKLEEDYDSITWKVVKNGKAMTKQRFWVKLPSCYDIDYTVESDSLYRDRIKAVREVMES